MASKLGLNLNQNRNDWKQKIISKKSTNILGTTEFCISRMHNILNIQRKPQYYGNGLDRTSLTWEKWNICHISQ